jgi:spore coat polysaccharide biosynthesis protein SpsF (cytidylyltransferase family)
MSKKNITAIIAARTGSSRLPNKVMLDLLGKTTLERMIERVKMSKTIDNIVIATSTQKNDKVIEKLCNEINIECITGSEEDLLSRYQLVVEKINPEIIVKMGADSILIDPLTIDKVVKTFLSNEYDYVSNYGIPKTYPEGCTADVYTSKTLTEAFLNAKKPSEREHINPYIWNNPQKYTSFRVDYERDISNFRLSLDYKEDYIVIKTIFENLYPKNNFFALEDIIEWLEKNPQIKKINSHYQASTGLFKSFKQDKEAGF